LLNPAYKLAQFFEDEGGAISFLIVGREPVSGSATCWPAGVAKNRT
jgi:hypothetical protein